MFAENKLKRIQRPNKATAGDEKHEMQHEHVSATS